MEKQKIRWAIFWIALGVMITITTFSFWALGYDDGFKDGFIFGGQAEKMSLEDNELFDTLERKDGFVAFKEEGCNTFYKPNGSYIWVCDLRIQN